MPHLANNSSPLRLPAPQLGPDERAVRSAYLASPRALPNGRPHPRSRFNNAGRKDGAARPWGAVVDDMHAVGRDALLSRCPAVVALAYADVVAFGDALTAHMASPLAAALGIGARPLADVVAGCIRQAAELTAATLDAERDGHYSEAELDEMEKRAQDVKRQADEALVGIAAARAALRERRRRGGR